MLIAANHIAYDYEMIVRHAPLVVDTQNATKGMAADHEKIVKA